MNKRDGVPHPLDSMKIPSLKLEICLGWKEKERVNYGYAYEKLYILILVVLRQTLQKIISA